MERYNDEELLYLVKCDSEMAKRYLLRIYYYRILQWAKPFVKYQYIGMELEDFVQIAMISFWNAIFSYRDDFATSLCTYVKTVVLRRIYSEIELKNERRLYKGKRPISLNDYVSDEDGYTYEEVIEDPSIIYQPRKILEVRETTTQYLTQFENKATEIEKEVMTYFLQGYNEKEIAEKLHIPIKSVYNAVYRGHKKVSH